jgi:hypothetical protein
MTLKELYKSITKNEWNFWRKVLAATVFFTSISRVAAVIMKPADAVLRGNVIFSFVDRYVYISYIEQARAGSFLFHDLFTSATESVPMLNIFWLGLGLFARATGLSANFVLEFWRIALIPFLLLVLYLLIAYFIADLWQRKLAYLLAAFGGGLGAWLTPLLVLLYPQERQSYNLPPDVSTPEAFVFLTNYYSAHFIFSTALLLGIFLLTLLAIDNKKISYAVPAGMMALILANFHPFSLIIAFFIFCVYFVFLLLDNRGKAKFLFQYALVLGAIAMPSIAYHLSMFKTPWWQEQTWRSTTYTQGFVSVMTGYGALTIFATYALYLSYRKKIEIKNEKFLLVWMLGQITMFFFPVSVQRRFFEGYAICFSILASYGLAHYLRKKPHIAGSKIYAGFAFTIVFCGSFFLVIVLDMMNVVQRGNVTYVKKDAIAAMQELSKIAVRDDLTLADVYNASMIPGVSLRRVFVGHGTETINFDYKYGALQRFMKSTDAIERQEILRNNDIKFVFYDAGWSKDWAWNPEGEKYLERVYEKGNYAIYKVK